MCIIGCVRIVHDGAKHYVQWARVPLQIFLPRMTTAILCKADLYTPRKCDATGQIITAKDHSSVQINIANVDAAGKAIPGDYETITLCGRVRYLGEADDSINRIASEKGLLKNVWSASL